MSDLKDIRNMNEVIVITAYEASSDIWENDFVTRKK